MSEMEIGGIVCAAIGLLLAGLGFLWGISILRSSMGASKATGVVRDVQAQRSGTDGIGHVYAPVVRFRTAQGQEIEFVSNVATPGRPQIGASVDVRYSPDNPQNATLASSKGVMMFVVVTIVGTGLGCAGLGVVLYLAG